MLKELTKDPGVIFSSSCKYDKMNVNNISFAKKKAMIEEKCIAAHIAATADYE
jgi:hypothetical protein